MGYEIIKLDLLYTKSRRSLLTAVAYRVLRLFSQTCSKETAVVDTRRIFARLCLADPTLLILVVVDQEGPIIGHGIANLIIDQDNGSREVFVQQCDVDTTSPPGVVNDLIAKCEVWGSENKATKMRFESPLDLHTARAWAKKYGFTLTSYEMERPIMPKA